MSGTIVPHQSVRMPDKNSIIFFLGISKKRKQCATVNFGITWIHIFIMVAGTTVNVGRYSGSEPVVRAVRC